MAEKTVYIVAFDGGGVRGKISARLFERFCQDANINPTQIYNRFDLILGTSIGGIQALGYAYGLSPTQMLSLIDNKGPDIFNSGIFTLPYYKERVVMGISTSSYIYDNTQITTAVNSVIPPLTKLSDLPGKVIVTSWNRATNLPVLFSNITGYEFFSGKDELVSNVATATTSAPIYFQEKEFSGGIYVDGGVVQNNPTLIGYHAAQNIFPRATRYCILSIGAGATYADVLSPTIPPSNDMLSSTIVPDRVQDLFYYMENVFIGGVQQLVDNLMYFTTQNPYKNIQYLRLQYKFLPNQDSALDDTDPTYLAQLVQYADEVYEENALKIENFIQHFNV